MRNSCLIEVDNFQKTLYRTWPFIKCPHNIMQLPDKVANRLLILHLTFIVLSNKLAYEIQQLICIRFATFVYFFFSYIPQLNEKKNPRLSGKMWGFKNITFSKWIFMNRDTQQSVLRSHLSREHDFVEFVWLKSHTVQCEYDENFSIVSKMVMNSTW